jgi:anti-anti-sigma regulatory factor
VLSFRSASEERHEAPPVHHAARRRSGGVDAYISSAGFRALLIANRAAAGQQGKLALCGVIGEVKRLFDIGGFTDEFVICPTQADGIGKLRQ